MIDDINGEGDKPPAHGKNLPLNCDFYFFSLLGSFSRTQSFE